MAGLGIDIGGSGIKGALVDLGGGTLLTERRRVPTPDSLQPEDVLEAVVGLVEGFGSDDGAVGVGFPAVVVDGVPRTGFTAHHVESWVGFPVAERLAERLGRPVTLVNDADAAGIAEMRYGCGRGEPGVVLLLTLGTGIGSALFVDGRLVPNTELGNLYLRSQPKVAEYYAASAARKRDDLKWKERAARLDAFLDHVERLFTPQLIIVGGGVSKRSEKFLPELSVKARIIPAKLRNEAGIIGAAVAAAGG